MGCQNVAVSGASVFIISAGTCDSLVQPRMKNLKNSKKKVLAAFAIWLGTLAWTQAPAQTVANIIGGVAGDGFAPLSIDVAGVDFGSSTITIQGVKFTAGDFTPEGGIISGTFPVPQSFGFGNTPNDNGMATLLSHSTFAYTQGTQYSSLTSGDMYNQYQFSGLTVGQMYQVDVFTVCDSNPRPTLTQIVGATTNSYVVETEVHSAGRHL